MADQQQEPTETSSWHLPTLENIKKLNPGKKNLGVATLGALVGSGSSILGIKNNLYVQKKLGLYTKKNAIKLFCSSSSSSRRRRNAKKSKGGRRTRRR